LVSSSWPTGWAAITPAAIETVRGFVAQTKDSTDSTWPFGYDPKMSPDGNRLSTAVRLANRRIYNESKSDEKFAGMGTTTVAAIVDHDRLSFSNVGDSRIYSFHGGQLEQLTRDHSWAAEVLSRDPSITPEQLAKNPNRHILTNAVGAREQTTVDIYDRTMSDGEVVLLCSDGLHGPVDDTTMAQVLGSSTDLPTIADRLIEHALERGGWDNITALLIRYTRD
jgi:serine/threonine protein phosphatase PrpC